MQAWDFKGFQARPVALHSLLALPLKLAQLVLDGHFIELNK